LIGSTFASRVATSLNKAIGEIMNIYDLHALASTYLIGLDSIMSASTNKEYVNMANRLVHINQDTLRSKVLAEYGHCLFNSSLFAKKLEYAYSALIDLRRLKNSYSLHSDLNSRRVNGFHIISGVNLSRI
jgi:predicted O-linked N-acetylglucosamine transferase (SPINDLY family)